MIDGFVEELLRRGEEEAFVSALSSWGIQGNGSLVDLEPWKLVSAESAFCVVLVSDGCKLVVKAPLTGGRARALELESRARRLHSFGVESATLGAFGSLIVQRYVPLVARDLGTYNPQAIAAARTRVAELLEAVLNAGFAPLDVVRDLRFFTDLRPALVDLGQDLGHFGAKSPGRDPDEFVAVQLRELDRLLGSPPSVQDS